MNREQYERHQRIIRNISKHNQRMELDPDYRNKWLAAINEADYDAAAWAKEDE